RKLHEISCSTQSARDPQHRRLVQLRAAGELTQRNLGLAGFERVQNRKRAGDRRDTGPAAGWLGTRYHRGFDPAVVIEPVLRELAHETRESAAFYVREGNARVCVVRVDGPQPIRYHARLGEVLPLEKGAAGRVLLAYSGEPGEPYESVRRAGYAVTFGERDPAVASMAAPVFGQNHVLVGCVAVTGPVDRLTPAKAGRHIRSLRKAASRLTAELGGAVLTVRRFR
ncbi:MAG: IclR family transcriptional regulator, partial [Sphingomonas hengshuiensis]